jgi:hypothetical protein
MSGAPSAQPSEQTRALEEVIFKRELNEVYLLIDFISGRTDRSLDRLTDLPGPAADLTTPPLSPSQVISTVCQFRYPPTGSAEVNGNNAAFLLRVKDKLNRLADPAGGFSIAFTSLFVGQRAKKADHGEYSCLEFARRAYPSLERGAQRLRHLLLGLSFCAGFLVILAAWTSGHVALGQALPRRLDEVRQQSTALATSSNTAPAPGSPAATGAGSPAVVPPPKAISRQLALAYQDIGEYKRSSSFRFLEGMLDPGRQRVTSCVAASAEPDAAAASGKSPRACNDSPGSEQAVAAVLAVFTNYALPMLFGLLGTTAAAVRDIQNKVRESTLSPRDYALSLVRLPLGVMAGLAVGLFFSPSTSVAVPQGVGTGIASTLTLTAGGLAFLAGYGAEAFFRMLDQVILVKFVLPSTSSNVDGTTRKS